MKEFIESHQNILTPISLIPIAVAWFSLNFYTGVTRKLDLMIKDIRKTGRVSAKTLQYDKYTNNNDQGWLDITFLTHLFFFVPGKSMNEDLYKDKFFINQLSIVKVYRRFYKGMFIYMLLLIATFILIHNS